MALRGKRSGKVASKKTPRGVKRRFHPLERLEQRRLLAFDLLSASTIGASLSSGVIAEDTTAIELQFSEAVDSGLGATPFGLQSTGADGLLGTADDTNVAINEVDYSGAIVTLGFDELPQEVYRFNIDDALVSSGGESLDGNSDGVSGGDYSIDFVVDANENDIRLVSTPDLDDEFLANDESKNSDVTADGRYVVFESAADNLVDGDTNGSSDVFLRDMETGGLAIISVTQDGTQGNGDSIEPRITDDGRYVVFTSSASNLVDGDDNAWSDVFRKDLLTGEVLLVSSDPSGVIGNGRSIQPSISSDGQVVAFSSAATNFSPGDGLLFDVFVKNLADNSLVRFGGDPTEQNSASGQPEISGNGQSVAFASGADSIVPGFDNDLSDIFVGIVSDGTVELVSTDVNGTISDGWSTRPSVSDDGRYVVFDSLADNLSDDDSNNLDVFMKDRQTGELTVLSPVAQTEQGPVTQAASQAVISGDGRFVAMVSGYNPELNLSGASGGLTLLTDVQSGAFSLLPRTNWEIDSSSAPNGPSSLSISQSGRHVVFEGVTRFDRSLERHVYWVDAADPVVPYDLHTKSGVGFQIDVSNYGFGQLVEGPFGLFDGVGRVHIDDVDSMQNQWPIQRGLVVGVSASETNQIAVYRDILNNRTGDNVTTKVTFLGNLGANGSTTVFATSDGDLELEATDEWFGIDDGDPSTPATIFVIQGNDGFYQPSHVQLIGDNIVWEYQINIAARANPSLAHFVIAGATRADALAAVDSISNIEGFLEGGTIGRDIYGRTGGVGSPLNFRFFSAPVANDDLVATQATNVRTFNVLENNLGATGQDTDVNNDIDPALTVALSEPNLGVLTNNGDGTFTFDPDGQFDHLAANQVQEVFFEYVITDSKGLQSDPATVTIRVGGINDPPQIDELPNGGVVNLPSVVAVDTVIANPASSDPDQDDSTTWTFESGNENGAFNIDSSTGAISVADPTLLENIPLAGIDLTVRASDASGLFDETTLTILPVGSCQFLVRTTDDSGACSLREIISQANASDQPVTISFDIPGVGPHIIDLLSPLPPIVSPVTIDGTSEPDYAGTPVIGLSGDSLSAVADGLRIEATGATIRGLSIYGFGSEGIDVRGGGNHVFSQNYIGIDTNGAANGNRFGIQVRDSSGNAFDANVISGNNGSGVLVNGNVSTGNVFTNNFVGTSPYGQSAIANRGAGLLIRSPENVIGLAGHGNLVSGNTGIGLTLGAAASQTSVQGNQFGTNIDGNLAIPNGSYGALVNSANNTVGGSSLDGTGNQFSGSTRHGLTISGAQASGNQVQGNYFGTDLFGQQDVGNGSYGIYIVNADNNVVGGTNPGQENIISGNDRAGLTISNGDGNQIIGNLIGVAAGGESALANGSVGVCLLNGATNNIISGNQIAGNASSGIFVGGETTRGNRFEFNRVGTNSDSTSIVGNGAFAILIASPDNVFDRNTVGGSTRGIVLSGPGARGNSIGGNSIGTNIARSANLGMTTGIQFAKGAGGNTVSGNTIANANTGVKFLGNSGSRNRISQNDFYNCQTTIDHAPQTYLVNRPVILDAELIGDDLRITFRVPVTNEADIPLTVEFFATDANGSSQLFVGEVSYSSEDVLNRFATVTIAGQPGVFAGVTHLTATATDSAGNTSDFAIPYELGQAAVLPDLFASDVSGPVIARAFQQVTLDYLVQNIGIASASGGRTDVVYLSSDAEFDPVVDQPLNSTTNSSAIAEGMQESPAIDLTLPDLTAGDYFLIVNVNDDGSISEQTYENNFAVFPLTVTSALTIVNQNPIGTTNENISRITLMTSEDVEFIGANDAETYELIDLGADRQIGGGDDQMIPVAPIYLAGTNRIDLRPVLAGNDIELAQWVERDYDDNDSQGDWRLQNKGESVKQFTNGGATFFVSDFDFVDREFVGRIRVETTEDDDFIGVAFGVDIDDQTGDPDNYYLLEWKQFDQDNGEAGFKLLKATNFAQLDILTINSWVVDGEDAILGGSQLEVLARNTASDLGWEDDTEYEFGFRYESSGEISVSIRRSSDGAELWSETLADPDPLGPGKVAFYNFSQAEVRYSGLQQTGFLPEGAYQLLVKSGASGIETPSGAPLDGDPSEPGSEDYIGAFVIDQTAPALSGASASTSQIDVSLDDVGGLDPISATNAANFSLVSSGGDGTFGDGNEVNQTIDSLVFANGSEDMVTLSLSSSLGVDSYQLTVRDVQDLAGNVMAPTTIHVNRFDVVVEGHASPYLSGMPVGTKLGATDTVFADHRDTNEDNATPTPVVGLDPALTPFLTFAAQGMTGNTGTDDKGPDGGGNPASHGADDENGFSDIDAPISSLLGVFLDDNQPDAFAPPTKLSFLSSDVFPNGMQYDVLQPELRQIFFIGDGRTDDAFIQQVVAPANATRLFLGTMDGGNWNNNGGFLDVQITATSPPLLIESEFIEVAQSDTIAPETTFTTLSLDVNLDGAVSPIDALLVVNALEIRRVQGESGTSLQSELDVNRDGRISPLDALHVINHLKFEDSETRAIELLHSQVDSIFADDEIEEFGLLLDERLF